MATALPSSLRGRLGRLVTPLLIALLLIGAACSGLAGPSDQTTDRPASRRVVPTQTAATSITATPSAAEASETLDAVYLYDVYQRILEQYVDPVDHTVLIEAASHAVRDLLVKQGVGPLDTAALDLAPRLVGDPERDWNSFSTGFVALTRKFPEWAAAKHPDYAAIEAMLAALGDNHTSFSDPATNRRRNEQSYAGIGVRLGRGDETAPPVVTEVFRDTPASRSGLRPGDRIVEADGQSLNGLSLDEVVTRIRGPRGTEVQLVVERPDGSRQTLTIVRAEVTVLPVDAAMVGSVGYVKIRSFAEASVADLVRQALTNGRSRGARAWIVDLRGNSGGLFDVVARVSGHWLDDRPIAVAVDRQHRRTPLTAAGEPIVSDLPTVVLIDGDTASGAEVLAAALREYGKAYLIGTRTAGSVGLAQSFELPDGSSVQITVQRLFTPSGVRLDGDGVTPDAVVELTDADLAAGRDPQIERAAEYLQSLGIGT